MEILYIHTAVHTFKLYLHAVHSVLHWRYPKKFTKIKRSLMHPMLLIEAYFVYFVRRRKRYGIRCMHPPIIGWCVCHGERNFVDI